MGKAKQNKYEIFFGHYLPLFFNLYFCSTNFGMQPLISIVTTYYNSAILGDFVKTSMQCLQSQTYPNLEFICVEDGSTDDTLQQLKSFAANDTRIKIYSKKNQKYAQYSKGFGQEKASGEFIFLFDHDDLIEPETIEKAFSTFQKNPELDIVTPLVKAQFTNGKVKYLSNLDVLLKDHSAFTFRKISGKEAIQKTVGKYDIHIRGLYRSNIFKSVSFNFTEPLLNADEIVERQIFEKARYIGSCDAVYTHFIHDNSSAKAPSLKKIDIVRTDVLLRRLFKEKNIYQENPLVFELTAYKNLVNGIKTVHFFKNKISDSELELQKKRLAEGYENLDKKAVLSSFSGLKKAYNTLLISSFSVLYLFYGLKK